MVRSSTAYHSEALQLLSSHNVVALPMLETSWMSMAHRMMKARNDLHSQSAAHQEPRVHAQDHRMEARGNGEPTEATVVELAAIPLFDDLIESTHDEDTLPATAQMRCWAV